MRMISPIADEDYQKAFDDLENDNVLDFIAKYKQLDFNKEVIHIVGGNTSETKDENLVNAIINKLLNYSTTKIIKSQLKDMIYALLDANNIDFIKRDINGRTPLNNFFTSLLEDLDYYYDEFNIVDLHTMSNNINLYCAMLNKCIENKYEWNNLAHPLHKIVVNVDTPKSTSWFPFGKSAQPTKRELNQVELFQNFLTNFRLSEAFTKTLSDLSVDMFLQEKLKGQVFHMTHNTEINQYRIENSFSANDTNYLKELSTQIAGSKKKIQVPPINTNVRSTTKASSFLDLIASQSPEDYSQYPVYIASDNKKPEINNNASPATTSVNESPISDISDISEDTLCTSKSPHLEHNLQEALSPVREENLIPQDNSLNAETPKAAQLEAKEEEKKVNSQEENITNPTSKEVTISVPKSKQEQIKAKVKQYWPAMKKYLTIALYAVFACAGIYLSACLAKKVAPRFSQTITEKTNQSINFIKHLSTSTLWRDTIKKPQTTLISK